LVLNGGGQVIPIPQAAGAAHEDVVLGVRPEDVDIAQGALPPGQVAVPAVVEVVEPLGADTLVFASMAGQSVAARGSPDVRPLPGATVTLRLNSVRAPVFDAASGQAVRLAIH
jgi:multiple sugar transport system ATP-binding protein